MNKFGWRRDQPDHRDLHLAFADSSFVLPKSVDLRLSFPPPYNQMDLGSCTANAVAGLLEFTGEESGSDKPTPSRLFQYWNTRVIEGTSGYDSGATIRDSIKAVVKYGFCPEALWPYVTTQFASKPPRAAFDAASPHCLTISSYQRVPQSSADIKAQLAKKNPVVFGFSVYQSFNSIGHDGFMPVPTSMDKKLGGHAVLLAGYDDGKEHFLVRNSWGQHWGLGGYFWMPYQVALNSHMSSDFWTITAVT